MRIEESIIIRRPHAEVFAFFDDRRNDSRWMGNVIESEWLDSAATTELGRRGRMVMKAFGRREFVDEVTEYQPGRRVGHRGVDGSLMVNSACYADPVPEGTRATVVFEPERIPGGPLGRWLEPPLARAVRRSFRADLVRLKRILEQGNDGGLPNRPTLRRWLGAAGVLAPVLFTTSAIAHSLTRADHALLNHPVSALAAGPTGWIQNLTFMVTGLLVVALGVGVHRHLPRTRLGSSLLVVFGLALVASGIFPATDSAGAFTEDRISHVIAGFFAFGSAPLAALAMGWRRRSERTCFPSYLRTSGAVLVVLFLAVAALVRPPEAPLHDWLGAFQWLFLAVWFPCLIAISRQLLAESRSVPDRVRVGGLASDM